LFYFDSETISSFGSVRFEVNFFKEKIPKKVHPVTWLEDFLTWK